MIRRLTALGAALILAVALSPQSGAAQLAAVGATKLSLLGSGFIGSSSTNLTNIFGMSKFGASGLEIGGDVMVSVSKQQSYPSYDIDPYTGEYVETPGEDSEVSYSGFFFGRMAYNFISESTTVPFVTVGVGAPIDPNAKTLPVLLNFGGGFKKFISERASFDVMANYQGQMLDGEISWQDGLSLVYGLSFYVGGKR